MFVCRECCVLSGRDLCDGPITRPEESYRLWFVVVCDLENLKNEEAVARDWAANALKKLLVDPLQYSPRRGRHTLMWEREGIYR